MSPTISRVPAIPTIPLVNATSIPQLGFGTYKVTENVAEVLRSALDLGYRHIDTAQMYGNEAQIGQAWKDSGIARDQLFITSKLNNPNHPRQKARESFNQTLKDLQTDYVDLFLVHWPLKGDGFVDTWRLLEEFYQEGRAKAIGVSNFEPHHLETLREAGCSTPMVNQIESHPYLANKEIHRYDQEHGIITEAWSPLARGVLLNDPVLVSIGEQLGVSPAQVALRWAIQRGDVIFPKSVTPQRQATNIDVFAFELSNEQMRQVDGLDKGEAGRTGTHPDQLG